MTLGRLLIEGGWPMVPIYLCSIAALAICLRKASQFLAVERADDPDWLEGVLEHVRAGRVHAAHERARRIPHPAARAVSAALAVVHRRPDRASAEAGRVGSLELQSLERHLGTLALLARIAPLLGLLGTVIGMVGLFLDLEGVGRAALDVSRLSSGIWTALLTTAAGLVVAVPTLTSYSYLAARADRVRLRMRDAVEQVLTTLPTPARAPDADSTTAPGSEGESGGD